jgi:hypothetical protein
MVIMKKSLLVLLLSIFIAVFSHAQEGMWLMSQLGQLDLQKQGIQLQDNEIYNPDKPALYNAIIQIGGGTGSFVSPDGLIITNHHVAYTALQRASSVEHDYLTNGFTAWNRQEEIEAPGYQAQMLTEMKDVTQEVLDAVKKITDPVEKDKKIQAKISEMTDKIKKDKDDINATIVEMYSGRQYILFVYKLIKDLRIVYAPPMAIGNYGGEVDNWMWPRHTGDFSFLRAYIAPDGTGREYNSENVPFHPKVWLKVAKEPLKEGDMTFIIGYPGFTTRYRTSNSADWNLNNNYPYSIETFNDIINILHETTKNDQEGWLKVASLEKGLANAMKNYQGKVDGMKKTNYVQKKLDFEKEFLAWANSDPARKEKYSSLVSDIKKEYDVIRKTADKDNVMGSLQGLAGTLTGIAGQLYRVSDEMSKPEKERDPGFTEKNVEQQLENLHYTYANYYEPADQAMFVYILKKASGLPADQRIKGLEPILSDKSQSIEKFADKAYANSKLNDMEYVKTLFKMSPVELKALNDPFINIAIAIDPEIKANQKTYESFAANVTELRKKYIDALYEWKGGNLYPDANGTMRFTYGPIRGYDPADAVTYHPFTSLKGVIEKNTGKEPFNAPEGLVSLYEKKDFGKWMDPQRKDVPVAFTHMADITGGNSGSPVMNAKGEIIGVAFDGNYEAMISDWQYDYDIQRTISVDIRYVMFILDKFGKADILIKEMGVAK